MPSPFADLLNAWDAGTEPLQFLAEAAAAWEAFGAYDRAIAIYDALALIAPDDPAAHIGLAGVHLARRDFRKAEAEAKLASRSGNRTPVSVALAYTLQARAWLGLNRPADALAAWRSAAAADPDGPIGRGAAEWLEWARDQNLATGRAVPDNRS